MLRSLFALGLSIALNPTLALAEETVSVDEAAASLRKGVEYFRNKVSIRGGYLWRYAADFSEREGEVPASATTAWVQPPGTPSVGEAYLKVYELTGDDYYLDAARETALALVHGQLKSGGWDYRIEFDPRDRADHAYRTGDQQFDETSKKKTPRNTTTLDDDTTQAAVRFLIRVDRALGFQDEAIHECTLFALQALLDAQYPNGAWPQRFSAPPDPEKYPVKPAEYPAEWSREFPKRDYRNYYTFNDNAIADMIDLMFQAAEVYGDARYTQAAERAGDFILLAQMPEPQPGWAQQYDADMHPAWARKFEPPAVTGGEGQGVLQTLLRLYEYTGKSKYLEPVPRALAYYQSSVLPDGRLARFYELHTNKPLYFTKEYQLTYDDSDLPTHYGFKTSNRLDRIAKAYERLRASKFDLRRRAALTAPETPPRRSTKLTERAAAVVAAQREDGAWVEPAPNRSRSKIAAGVDSLNSQTFIDNIVTLARFVTAQDKRRR